MSGPPHEFTVPPGYHPPFAIVTDKDHTAWILIGTALGLALSLMFAGIRLFVRCSISRRFGLDDIVLFGATAVGVVQAALIFTACDAGLGKSADIIPLETVQKVQKIYYASCIVYAMALGLSKASVALFMLRVAPFNPHRLVTLLASSLIFVWTFVLIIIVALRCDLSHPWIYLGSKCGRLLRWEIMEALGCLFEVVIFSMAVWIVSGVGRISKGDKATVIVMFAFRLPIIVSIVYRFKSFEHEGDISDPTLLEGPYITWTQAELSYSLLSSTILVLRPFVNQLTTYYGGHGRADKGIKSNTYDTYQMSLLGIESRRPTGATLTTEGTRSDSIQTADRPYHSLSLSRQRAYVDNSMEILPHAGV